jgi:hypothetical protein
MTPSTPQRHKLSPEKAGRAKEANAALISSFLKYAEKRLEPGAEFDKLIRRPPNRFTPLPGSQQCAQVAREHPCTSSCTCCGCAGLAGCLSGDWYRGQVRHCKSCEQRHMPTPQQSMS